MFDFGNKIYKNVLIFGHEFGLLTVTGVSRQCGYFHQENEKTWKKIKHFQMPYSMEYKNIASYCCNNNNCCWKWKKDWILAKTCTTSLLYDVLWAHYGPRKKTKANNNLHVCIPCPHFPQINTSHLSVQSPVVPYHLQHLYQKYKENIKMHCPLVSKALKWCNWALESTRISNKLL